MRPSVRTFVDGCISGADSYKTVKYKSELVISGGSGGRGGRGAEMASRGRSVPPRHTFLTFWCVGSRGGVLCAIVAREGTAGRRPARPARPAGPAPHNPTALWPARRLCRLPT